jgi:hypothetical protein
LRSSSAACRTRPSSDIVDGSTARRAQLIGVQALTLQLQGETLTTEELDQCRPLIAE